MYSDNISPRRGSGSHGTDRQNADLRYAVSALLYWCSPALTFKVVYCNSFTVNPVHQWLRKGNLPTIRLAPPFSYLIELFVSTNTSAGPDGAFVTEDSLNSEIIGYAYFVLGDTPDIDPD